MVHLTRNAIARVPKTAQAMVAATVRSIFEQPDRAATEAQLRRVCETLGPYRHESIPQARQIQGEWLFCALAALAMLSRFHDWPVHARTTG